MVERTVCPDQEIVLRLTLAVTRDAYGDGEYAEVLGVGDRM
jgi:hypothetical protein